MTAVKKASLNLNDIPGFIDACFDPEVRSESAVVSAAKSGALYYTFVDDASCATILNAWLAAWQKAAGDAYNAADEANCPPYDRTMIAFFASTYFKSSQALRYCQPKLTYKGMQGKSDKATYSNSGYTAMNFFSGSAFNYGSFDAAGVPTGSNPTVATFLRSLFLGGHHVFVSSSDDTHQSITNAYNAFRDSALTQSHDPENSHYTTSLPGGTPVSWNGTGYYYQSVTGDSALGNNALMLSLLFGETSDNHTNTFMQLEGWPNVSNSSRHGVDYDAYKDTLWNYGTYAACAWSEKRCTPIFIAPSDFSTSMNSKTHMPLYNGAGSKQNWMDTDLLVVD